MHGLRTERDDVAWTSPTRTPPLYPDAVTLVPDPSMPDLLARVDVTPGCSVKDSFASVDLTAHGFHVLFEAEWIVRADYGGPSTVTGPRWERVRDADGLLVWEHSWRGDDGPSGIWRPELLRNEEVAVLAARTGDSVVAGAVLNRSAGVVGLSNFFAPPAVASDSLEGCLAFASALFPETPVVGYAAGGEFETARACGFTTMGPLRVWLHGG